MSNMGALPVAPRKSPATAQHASMRLGIGLTVLALVGMAGCMDDGDEQASEASVSFDDAGDGAHDDSTQCTDGASLYGGGLVDDGQVQVTVTDGEGDQVFSGSYDDAVDLEAENLEGADGTWKVTAQRDGGFSGDYLFTLLCT